jgi:uncharacterized protein
MKWFLYLLLAILIPSVFVFNKALTEIRRQLDIHSTEDKVNSVMAQSAEVKYFQSSDHQKLAYWYFPVKNAKAVVILAHGFANPGGKSQMIAHALYLKKAGYTTIIPDLRSFGDSEGYHIYLGTKEWQDLVNVYDLVRSFPENKDKKIGYLGVSMGAAASITAVAQSQKGDFVIASVPFKSYDSLAKFRLKDNKYLPLIWPIIKIASIIDLGSDYSQYSAVNNIGDVHVPVLIFRASRDEYVNNQDAKDLFNLANGPKEYWLADSTHDIHANLPQDFEKKVLAFLKKYIQ